MNDYQPIRLTELAIQQIKEVMVQENLSDAHRLRIGVIGGGCAGLQFSLDFTDKISEEYDFEFEEIGFKFVVDCFSAALLNGTTIDYVDGLQGSGFKFNNSNFVKKCGCGESFGY